MRSSLYGGQTIDYIPTKMALHFSKSLPTTIEKDIKLLSHPSNCILVNEMTVASPKFEKKRVVYFYFF